MINYSKNHVEIFHAGTIAGRQIRYRIFSKKNLVDGAKRARICASVYHQAERSLEYFLDGQKVGLRDLVSKAAEYCGGEVAMINTNNFCRETKRSRKRFRLKFEMNENNLATV